MRLVVLVVIQFSNAPAVGRPPRGLFISRETPHAWRPPFGLDRVGQPITLTVTLSESPGLAEYELSVLWQGKEVARHRVPLGPKTPYSARVTIEDTGDEVVLFTRENKEQGWVEVGRQRLDLPRIEADAQARPDTVVNPVDLGTILVPSGWLLLGPGQGGVVEVAARWRNPKRPTGRFAHGSGRSLKR